jgi:hypothetical protein
MTSSCEFRVAQRFAAVYISGYPTMLSLQAWGLSMIGNVTSDGRLLSLRGFEWLMLIAGGVVSSLILMF